MVREKKRAWQEICKECGSLRRQCPRDKWDCTFCRRRRQRKYKNRSDIYYYRAWNGMKDRCYNKNNNSYHRYGGRGISVHEPWLSSYATFYTDLMSKIGPRPSLDHSLDRIHNDGDYEPNNLKWSTSKEQSNNTGVSRRRKGMVDLNEIVVKDNEVWTLLNLSWETGIPEKVLRYRYSINSEVDSLINPKSKHHKYDYKGHNYTGTELAIIGDLPEYVINNRINSGWDVIPTVETPHRPTKNKNGRKLIMRNDFTIQDVTRDLKFLMTLTDIFGVDEQGFWIDILKDERFKYQIDNSEPKEIVVFQDPFPKGDFYYFNPLAEGLGDKSPATKLFERTVRANFNANLRIAVIKLLTALVASKEKDGESLNHVELRMASVPIDKKTSLIDYADEKLIDEVKKIFDRTHENFFSVAYIQAQQTARAHCDVFSDPQWSEKYGADIRKKSIIAFKVAILGILGLEDEKDFSQFSVKYNPDSKSAAKLDTTLRVYHKLYNRFNDILPEARAIDLGTLNEVIDRLPMAYAIAKHMVQPSLPRHKPNDLSPSDTSHLGGPVSSSGKRMPSPIVGGDRGPMIIPNNRFQPIPSTPAVAPGKFQPQFLNSGPVDPTAPLVNMGTPGFGMGNQGGGFGPTNRNYFGGGSSFTQPFGTPNLQPGNLFGRPEMTRRYFT